jgi:hypothetical protein
MGRGELVALLDAAPGALRTLRGTVRRWTHLGRQRTAIERANEARGGVHSVQLTVGTWSGGTPAEATEWHSRVWFEAPNHWRGEGDDTTLYISDGDRRWEGFTSFVTERGESPSLAVDAVRFVCPDEAVVWFSLEIGGEQSPFVRQRRGRAVRVGGRWLIERGTIAELLAFAGVHVPPP